MNKLPVSRGKMPSKHLSILVLKSRTGKAVTSQWLTEQNSAYQSGL